jgi:hypothetical protein
MKKIYLSIAVLFMLHSVSFACRCSLLSIADKYMRSDFIAKVKVAKVYPNATKESETYRIDIVILDIYKGEKVNWIEVYGSNGGTGLINSCGTNVGENTIWYFYARKTKSSVYAMPYCSGSEPYPSRPSLYDSLAHPKAYQFLLDLRNKDHVRLQMLQKNKLDTIKFNHHFYNVETTLQLFLDKYRGAPIKGDFAVYLVTFHSDYRVKKVKIISGFKEKIDKDLVRFIKNTTSFRTRSKTVEQDTKLLINVYSYNDDKTKPNILTTFAIE